jgi:hypothetical protein
MVYFTTMSLRIVIVGEKIPIMRSTSDRTNTRDKHVRMSAWGRVKGAGSAGMASLLELFDTGGEDGDECITLWE